MYVGYTVLLGRRVTSEEFSRCYDDVNICLWTDGSDLTQPAAQTACQRRNSFLPRVTSDDIQSKLADFRSYAHAALYISGFWIDVRRDNAAFHWIDGSQFAGLLHAYTDNCFCVTREVFITGICRIADKSYLFTILTATAARLRFDVPQGSQS